MIFLGPDKNETMLMIFFDTKYRDTDISGFAGGNHDFYLHCFGIFHVHVQVSDYKMSGYFWVSVKLSDIFRSAEKFLDKAPSVRVEHLYSAGLGNEETQKEIQEYKAVKLCYC